MAQLELGEEDTRLLAEAILEIAANAREDFPTFFEFVMKEESSKRPITLAAHQRVGLEFIMAHDRSVNMWPVNSSKTFCMSALTLWYLGRDPSLRGAIISATESQAAKIVSIVRDYIETSQELQLVFPGLCRSQRSGDPWTQTKITINRPAGIRDASLTAYGESSPQIQGSRLNWIMIDDLVTTENTTSKDLREKTKLWLEKQVLSRLDPLGLKHETTRPKVVFTNTPYHPDDAVHDMMKPLQAGGKGWAFMRMDVYGDVEIFDDDEVFVPDSPRYNKPWDSPLLRSVDPRNPADARCRLVAHDPDPSMIVPLWPERLSIQWIEEQKRRKLPVTFNQLHRCICRDDATSMCKVEHIELCLARAREMGIFSMVSEYRGGNLVFTGVDLAISPGEERDDTAFFTFEARPGGLNVILDVEIGQWDGPTIIDKLFDKIQRYKSVARVENNGAQEYLLQFARRRNLSIPIKPHTTEHRAKAHPEYGVPGFFVELSNGAWAIPNTQRREKHPMIQKLIDECLYYVPSKHTADVLMAVYFAREQKREWVGLGGDPGPGGDGGGDIAGSVMMR